MPDLAIQDTQQSQDLATLKQELIENRFIEALIGNGFDASRAVKQVKPHLSRRSASVVGSRLLHSEGVRNKLASMVKSDDVGKVFRDAFNARRPDSISFRELLGYVRTVFEVEGVIGSQARNNDNNRVQVALVVEN